MMPTFTSRLASSRSARMRKVTDLPAPGACDEGEAALADELLGAPAEGFDAAADVQGLVGHVGSERAPLEAVEGEHFPVHEALPWSSSLGR